MPCVTPDGQPTESGLKMLGAVKTGKTKPEDIAAATDMPLFRVRSGIRDMVAAGFVLDNGELYVLTEKGLSVI